MALNGTDLAIQYGMAPDHVNDTAVISRPRVEAIVLLAATALGVYLCYRLIQPFLPALSWGLALAVVGYPLHKHICRRIPRATPAAALTVALIAILIIGPIVFVSQQLVKQLIQGITIIRDAFQTQSWRALLETRPWLASLAAWVETTFDLDGLLPRIGGYVEEWGPSVLAGSVGVAVQLLITLLVLFYFFRDKRDLAADVRSFLPLSEREADQVIHRVTDTIQATIFGSLTVAAVQGFMGGLMFAILGLPAPILWGAVMAVLATIPVAGTFMVWAPAAVYLAMTGSWGKAVILASWGGTAIALIDNLLYPVLVGKQLRFHPLAVFFSIVGGLSLFGAAGLVLGPLTLSVTAALLEVLRRRTAARRAVDTPRVAA
jgi:predicted PurR-regulated permease PerM